MFGTYFQFGLHHIADLNAFDHILFLFVLVAVYTLKDFVRIAILVTAFTIGHSITLVLATLDMIVFREDVIEFLIPLTIFLTAVVNLFNRGKESKLTGRIKYAFALFFGLIHGLGFSFYLRSLLGKEDQIWQPLLAFNLGVEAGQLLIVLVLLLIAALLIRVARIPQRNWILVTSGAAMGMAFRMMQENAFW